MNENIKKYGLYIHIPFCVKKCKYCDFVSFCGKQRYFDEYIDMLLEEAKEYEGKYIDTVFIGGGTPSILSEEQLKRLIFGIRKIFVISDTAEFTVEANPGTLTKEKLLTLKNCGINRLSLGVQSFNDDELRAIGRIHSSKEAYNAVEEAKKAGFDNINLDLMLNLPNQSRESLENTLKTAIELNPAHLSCYSLILEDGTPLLCEYENGKYIEPSDEYDRELYHFTVEYLKKYGYERYEISNFSKPERQCAHNIKYWSCDEYIGLGVAAHSYIDGVRFYNTSDLSEYLLKSFHKDDKEVLEMKDKICEYMIMKLRMCEGIEEKEFLLRFGKKPDEIYKKELEKFQKAGLIEKRDGFYKLTDYGIDVSNSVLCEFM